MRNNYVVRLWKYMSFQFNCFAAAISIVEFPSELSCSDNNDDGKKRGKSIGLKTRVSIYQVRYRYIRYNNCYPSALSAPQRFQDALFWFFVPVLDEVHLTGRNCLIVIPDTKLCRGRPRACLRRPLATGWPGVSPSASCEIDQLRGRYLI